MRSTMALALGLAASIAFALAAIYYVPPVDDFGPANPFWNGMSAFDKRLAPTAIQDLELLPNQGEGLALLIVGPSKHFSQVEVMAVSGFVSGGGTLVLADDFGTANELLQGLRLRTRISVSLLEDPLFNIRNPKFPRALAIAVGNLSSIAMDYATVLAIGDAGTTELAWSSHFSYLDLNGNGKRDAAEPMGPFAVMARIPYGQGGIYLISDCSVFINGLIDRDDNAKLFAAIAGDRDPLLDVSHWSEGPLTAVKGLELSGYQLISRPDVRYGLLLLSVMLVLRFRIVGVKRAGVPDELERLLMEHPEWDRRILIALKEDRDGHGAS